MATKKITSGEILGIIPARGGSKGLPGKNIRLFSGAPLIVHTLRAAAASGLSDCVVSTDDATIAEIARAHGGKVPFLRPPELAGDEASVWPAVRLSVSRWEADTSRKLEAVVLLQPTSPLRLAQDIDGCVARFRESGADACVSVSLSHDNPYFNMVKPVPRDPRFARACSTAMRNHQRRQEVTPVYALNGAIYVVRRNRLDKFETPFQQGKLAMYEMPRSRSVDIDTEDDLALAEFWLGRAGGAE